MNGLLDLLKSERGLGFLALVIGATVLTAMSILTPDQWLDYTKWVFGIYVGGKTASSVTGLLMAGKTEAAKVEAAKPPAPAVTPTEPTAPAINVGVLVPA